MNLGRVKVLVMKIRGGISPATVSLQSWNCLLYKQERINRQKIRRRMRGHTYREGQRADTATGV